MKIILIPLLAMAVASVSCNKNETADPSGPPVENGAKPYPLDTCLVSGEKLGSMGEPVTISHEGQEIKFCCDSCVPEFEENPAKYLSKIHPQGHDH